jgi:glycosyltransferase involved in cell wall biosynthesis
VDRAIEIATQVEFPLRIAAKVDRVDRDYFDSVVKPLLRNPLVEFVGEIGEGEKDEFLGNAHALLFPIDWPEPFGLVMIEAMRVGDAAVDLSCRRHGNDVGINVLRREGDCAVVVQK